MDKDLEEDDDLLEADALLRKADVLLARGKGSEDVSDDDDLPLVTEIVPAETLTSGVWPKPETEPEPDTEVMEQLVDLDTVIKREIETWLSRELPEIVERELDLLRERIRAELTANMRVTLLPRLSDAIAVRLPPAGVTIRRR